MANNISIEDLQRSTVIDQDGDKVGKVGQVYLDDATGQPNWVTVNTGLFGGSETFVPLDEATLDGEDLRVPYTKAFIKDAPNLDADSHVDESQEDEGQDAAHQGQGGRVRLGMVRGCHNRRSSRSDWASGETRPPVRSSRHPGGLQLRRRWWTQARASSSLWPRAAIEAR